MAKWDLLFLSKTLKGKQEEMQISLTKIIDAVNGLNQEKDALAGIWRGSAKEQFMSAFTKASGKAAEAVNDMGKLISLYSQIEEEFEDCEKEIGKLL